MIREVVVSLLVFIVYVLFAGSISPYTLITGLLVGAILGLLTARYLVVNERKLLEIHRFLLLAWYFIKYMTVIEFKAHMDVIKRILTMDIKPGIVKVPVKSRTRYARLLVMGSITNTPGTVVVDERSDYFYVNWINVESTVPEEAWRVISEEFDKYATRIFD